MILSTPEPSCHAVYDCGPARLRLTYENSALHPALDALLSQYDAPWPAPTVAFSVTVGNGLPPAEFARPSGSYLQSYRLDVDRRGAHLISLSKVGVWMDLNETTRHAAILITDESDRETMIEEVEQQLVLVLARAWAMAGWTPLHGGTLIPPGQDRAVLVCAPSGVGKTTFTTAMLLQGWRTLGDDKVLLRSENGVIAARGLSHRFHLHPSQAKWFPQLGDIGRWPRYSRWTDKRMVKMKELWPSQLLDNAIPKAVIELTRGQSSEPLRFAPMDPVRMMKVVLNQIVLPGDANDVRPLAACASALTRQLRGALVTVGENAFASPDIVRQMETGLQELLS